MHRRALPLALGPELGAARFTTGAYGFWRTFVASQVRDAGIGDDTLLAPLAPEVYHYQRHVQKREVIEIKKALGRVANILSQ